MFSAGGCKLYVEPEVHHVSVLHFIGLTFFPKLIGRPEVDCATVLQELGNGVDLGSDKSPLEVGVDNACTFWGQTALAVGPCPDFLGASYWGICFYPSGFPGRKLPRMLPDAVAPTRHTAVARVSVNVPAAARRARGATIGGRLWQRHESFLSVVGVVL